MIKTAYLRVYVPAGSVPPVPPYVDVQRRVIRASDHFVWDEPLDDDAFTLEYGGRSYTCPRYPWLRMLEGLVAFTNTYPTLPLMTDQAILGYVEELSRLREDAPNIRSHILSSPWHVPLRWFAAFLPSDRDFTVEDGRSTIRYRGFVVDAVDRVAWAAGVLDDAGFSEHIADQVRDLEHWLGEFPRDAVVELDYGSVADLFSPGDLVVDESCADVRQSLLALERGDFGEAGDRYMAAASRWAPHQALTYSN